MTYWPRKCVTWCAPRGDSFHQVWSWYDHPLPRYCVIAADTLRDLDLWPFDFGQWSYMAGHVVNPSTKFDDSTAIRCWVTSSDISHRIPLTGEGRSLGGKISGNWMHYNYAADSFYIMKLCSRLFILHCRSRPKYDTSMHFDPHFEEVRGA